VNGGIKIFPPPPPPRAVEGREPVHRSAARVRYHNRKSQPADIHTSLLPLINADINLSAEVAAILRIAEALIISTGAR